MDCKAAGYCVFTLGADKCSVCGTSRAEIEGNAISKAEVAALHHFARLNGRHWKARLREAWAQGCDGMPRRAEGVEYRVTMIRLRYATYFGLAGLRRFRLPEGFYFLPTGA